MGFGNVNAPGISKPEFDAALKSLRDELLSGKMLSVELTTTEGAVITADNGEAITVSRKILFE